MIIGSMFFTPWPTSGFLFMMLTLPSGMNLMKAFACICPPPKPWAKRSESRLKATTMPPPASAVILMKERRLSAFVMAPPLLCGAAGRRGLRGAHRTVGRLEDGGANARVGSAAAQIAAHRGVDVGVGRLRGLRERGRGGHDLAGLAVTALRDVDVLPRDLQRVIPVRRQPFDRRDRGVADRRDLRDAGPDRGPVPVHGARTALVDAAAKLG